jgi:hypothetical protein
VRHWAEGGETTLGNTCLLCEAHHMLVHEGGWRMERRDGTWRFFRPDGSELTNPPLHLGPNPVEDLRVSQAGLHLTPETVRPTWDGSPVDLEWAARTLRRFEAPSP